MPGAPQRPRRQRDAARAAGREQPRRRQAGHRDQVAVAVRERRARRHVDAVEQRHVAGDRQQLERERRRQPRAVAVGDSLVGVLHAADLRQHEVQERDRREHEDGEQDHAPPRQRDARHLLLVVAARCRRTAARRAARSTPRAAGSYGALDGVLGHRPRPAPAPRSPARRRRRARASGPSDRRERAHALGQREPREQVDDVVLAQVHEREPERQRVRPAERALDPTRLGEQVRGVHGRGEVEGGHGGEGIASQHRVERPPAVLPELLAVLDHHAAHRRGRGGRRAGLSRPRTRAARSAAASRRARRGRRPRTSSRRRGRSARARARARRRSPRAGPRTTASASTRAPSRRGASRPARTAAAAAAASAARRGRARGRPAPGSRSARAARAPRGRRAASRTPPGRPTSAARTSRRRARACAGARRRSRRGRPPRSRARPASAGASGGARAVRRRRRRRPPTPRLGWPWTSAKRAGVYEGRLMHRAAVACATAPAPPP